MIEFQPKSTKFINELRSRYASFNGRKVAGRVTVPMDLKFWYWLEFGTAGRRDPTAPLPTQIAKPGKYPGTFLIEPLREGYPLAFPASSFPNAKTSPDPDGMFRFGAVSNPGIRPRLIVRSVLKQIMQTTGMDIGNALIENGFRLSILKNQLLNANLPDAVERIAIRLEEQAPGTREEGGKLDGNSAADMFREEALVVDTSK